VTQDDLQIQRRLLEGSYEHGQMADYDLSTFEKKQFADSVFALPGYCHEDKPQHCPLTSICTVALNDGNLQQTE